MDNPFELAVYDRNFTFRGYIGNPISVTATPRFNDVGTATVEIDLTHRLVPAILEEGSRMVIRKDKVFILSGKIVQKSSEGPSVTATLRLFVRGDFRMLKQILGWPKPLEPLINQLGKDDAMLISGVNVETAIKTVVQQNMVNRLAMPVTVATNQNRGGQLFSGTVLQFKFNTLYDGLFPAAEQYGLGVTFQQQGSSIVCDVFTPPVYKFTLTEESGVLQWWSWSTGEAAATRVVAAGKTEGETRLMSVAADTALEGSYHEVIEVFESISGGDTQAALDAGAQKELADKAPRSGFAVRLAETETFRYGKDNLVVGARITISVGGVTRTDYLRECTLSYTREDGVAVTPVVGEIQDNPDRQIANFLARLLKSINDLKVSK